MALTTLVRSLIAGALGLVLAVLGGSVFDEVMWQLLAVPVVVTVAVLASARWGSSAMIAVGVGSVLVVTAGVPVVSEGSVTDAVPGMWRAPRRLLTTEWPSPADPVMVAAVAFLVAAATAISVGLAASPRWRLLPLLPIAVAGPILLGLAAPEHPDARLLVVAAALVVAFAGSVPGQPVMTRRSLVPERTVTATVVAIAIVGVGAASVVAWEDRADPREIDDPEVSATLLDPIEATVAIRSTEPVIELATISDRSVLARPSMPRRWRLAAFEEYDGQRWVPDLDLRPIGGRLGEAVAGAGEEALDYRVQFHSDELDLLPLPGAAVVVDRDVETDLNRVAVRFIERPGPDTVVDATAVPPPSTNEALVASVVAAPVDEIAAAYTELARTLAGDGGDVERLGRLAQEMRFGWRLDSGAPGAGQQLALIDRFLVDTNRGTPEQFVTGFVLLSRSLGYETRIATGFDVPPDDLGAVFALRSEHAAVWPEVLLTDGRWLPFDPVPDAEAIEDRLDEQPPEQQTPAAAQPPAAEPVESDDEIEQADDEARVNDLGWGTWARWGRRVAVVSASVLLPIALLVGVVLLIKLRRRRARLRSSDPVERVRGAWANTTDSLVDAGLRIGPAWTDDRIADSSTAVVIGAPHETRRLAAMSSAVTFGSRPAEEAARLADDAARTASAIDAAIGASRTRWERIRWRLSLRSIRRATRSPVH